MCWSRSWCVAPKTAVRPWGPPSACGWPPPWACWPPGISSYAWALPALPFPSVALLYGIGLIFQAAEPLADWFRSRLQSVLPVLISCAAAASAALCQVGLLLAEQGTPWFALAHGLEAAVAVPLLALAYRRSAGRQLLRPDGTPLGTSGTEAGISALWSAGGSIRADGPGDAAGHAGRDCRGPVWSGQFHQHPVDLCAGALVETARPLLLARHHQDPSGFPRSWRPCIASFGTAPVRPGWASACWPARSWESSTAAHTCRLAVPYGYPPGGPPLPAWAQPGAFFWPPATNFNSKSTWPQWAPV